MGSKGIPESDRDQLHDLLTFRSTNFAFDLSPVPMILVDDALLVVEANPAAHRMLGDDHLIGTSVLSFQVTNRLGGAKSRKLPWFTTELTHYVRDVDLLISSGEAVTAEIQVDAVVFPSGRRYFFTQLREVNAEGRRARHSAAGRAQYMQLLDNLPDTSVMLFDRDLRLIVAAGDAIAATDHTGSLSGVLMRDAFPASEMALLEGRFRAALAGRATNFAYTSTVNGRRYRVRARPVVDTDGEVVRGLSIMEDVTAEQVQATQLDQMYQFHHFGGSSYDRKSGWSYSDNLLDMWGIGQEAAEAGLPASLLVPAERDATLENWSKVFTGSGRRSIYYNIVSLTGEVRNMRCTAASVVDSDDVLMQVVATHVDVTASVIASKEAELERMEAELAQFTAASERWGMVRQVGDMLATSRLQPHELLHSIVDLAASLIGDGAAIRILTPDQRHIERDVTAHPDESVRVRLDASLRRSAQEPVDQDRILTDVFAKGKLLTNFRPRAWLPEHQQSFADRVYDQAAHVMVAPVRHNGILLGNMAVFRTEPGQPYRAGDDDVLQVLADAAGAAIAENRTWQQAARQRDTQLAALQEDHVELLEQLSGLETHERSNLADAIHDEPIQRIVASVLRLEYLGTRMDATTRRGIDEITEQLVATVDWLRDLIVVALKPPDLSQGLGPALAGLAQAIFTSTPTLFTLSGVSHVRLSVPAKETAYRIFREALVNVRNHANATTVTLRLEELDELLQIRLTDDGDGSASFDAGTGHLGVVTMRARAAAEGWHLDIESVPGLGTTVTLKIKASPASAKNYSAPVDRLDPVDLDKLRRVVVCDDHHYLRDAVGLVLSTLPRFSIVGEASDGPTCLEQVRQYRPDILILDVGIPGGGPALAKAAKQLRPDMYILVFSGRKEDSVKSEMLDAGADQFLVKSGRLQPLVDALDVAIASTHAQDITSD